MDVLRLQVWVCREDLADVAAVGDQVDDKRDRDAQPANAGLASHDELLAGASAQAEVEADADDGAAPALSAYRVLLALKERRDLWAREAQPVLGKQSPLQVVKAERKAVRRRLGRGGRGGRKGRG